MMELIIHGHPYLHSTEKQLCNCRAIRAQFPLIPAAAVTIHKCQGSTLRNVVVDMDVSPSPYYAENFEAAKNLLNMLIMLQQAVCHQFQDYKL